LKIHRVFAILGGQKLVLDLKKYTKVIFLFFQEEKNELSQKTI